MSILNIRPAIRAGSKLVLGIAGQSGSGKTLTALYIARGMVDKASEIGFLDTENRRGSLYANELDGQFLIGDLFYPFSPERYATAIKEFQAAGVKVLIIDSVSHEWESGCIEIAELPMIKPNKYGKLSKVADWKKAKYEHKNKFMMTLLQSDMHIIACIRAAEKMNFSNPSKPESMGIQPLCEKNFMFEMTASVMMFNEGQQQQHIKIPRDLKKAFGDGQGYLGIETGQQIRAWLDSGNIDAELESYRNKMQLASNDGCDALKQAWQGMPQDMQAKLKSVKSVFWAAAQAIDKAASEEFTGGNADDEKPVASKGFDPAKIEKQDPEPHHQQQVAPPTDQDIADNF